MKFVISGLESSGKSLYLAEKALNLLHRNEKWYKKTGKKRKLVSNIKFADFVEEAYGDFIEYWKSPRELVKMRDVDVIWDEISTDLDAQTWKDQPRSLRRWLRQGAKTGVDIYGSAQEFADVDVAFRRRVNTLLWVSKIIGSRRPAPTKPDPKRIWGFCLIKELKAHPYEEDDKETKGWLGRPRIFEITEKRCSVFNTNQEIKHGEMPEFDHYVKRCSKSSCDYERVIHR